MSEEKIKFLAAKSPWVLVVDGQGAHPSIHLHEQRRVLGPPPLRFTRSGRGQLPGDSPLRSVLIPLIQKIISRVRDEEQIPLELHVHLNASATFRGELPLDDEAGYKLAIILTLCAGLSEPDRAELLARRVERFTREEAGYWVSRLFEFSEDANRFALDGMRTLLVGQPSDSEGVQRLLDDYRRKH